MDYADALQNLDQNLRDYYQAAIKHRVVELRNRMNMIHQFTLELELATQQLEREHAERVKRTIR